MNTREPFYPGPPPDEVILPSQHELQEQLVNWLDRLPELQARSLEELELAEVGTYRLQALPSAAFLRTLPYFKGGDAEVGLIAADGHAVITLTDETSKSWQGNPEVGLPADLPLRIQLAGLFQLDTHTHPGNDEAAWIPSHEDISNTYTTMDGLGYVINQRGLVEYHAPAGYKSIDTRNAWLQWLHNQGIVTEQDYAARGAHELSRQFFVEVCGMQVIPWEHETAIEAVLQKVHTRL